MICSDFLNIVETYSHDTLSKLSSSNYTPAGYCLVINDVNLDPHTGEVEYETYLINKILHDHIKFCDSSFIKAYKFSVNE